MQNLHFTMNYICALDILYVRCFFSFNTEAVYGNNIIKGKY